MRDFQTSQAIVKKWLGSPCETASPGGLFEGDKAEARPVDTYTIVASKPDGRANMRSTGSGSGSDNEIDYRRVTLVVYGLSKAAVAVAMQVIDSVFADRRDTFPANALDFAGAANWMRTESIAEAPDMIERAERTEVGQWWKGTLSYRVWTSRNH